MPFISTTRLLCAVMLLVLLCTGHISAANIPPVCVSYDTTYPSICGGLSYQVGSHSYTTTGSYLDTLAGSGGCDSVVLTNLTVDTTSDQIISLGGCSQVTYQGITYTSDTVIHQTYPYVHGCDSVVRVVIITIDDIVTSDQSPVICMGQSVTVGTNTYSSQGYYTDTLFHAAVGGCDSVVNTLLIVISPYTNTLTLIDTCIGSYNGLTYTSSNTLFDTLYSYLTNCDSVYLTVSINIVPPTLTTLHQSLTICPGDSFFAGGRYQTGPGIYYDTVYTVAGGCDSIITVTDLSLRIPQYFSHSYDSCNPVTIRGVIYTSDTILRDTTYSSLGCDSLVEIDTVSITGTAISIISTALLPITAGDSTQLIINPTGNYQNIVWTPNQWITNRYLADPIVVPIVSTAYMVSLQDSNNCTVTANIIVTVVPSNLPDFVMGNAFTPNGDGVNDLFTPILSPGAQVATFHIYNRWGELIFDNQQSGTNQWDGSYLGNQQPPGIYMYFITVLTLSGKSVYQEGNFTLMR